MSKLQDQAPPLSAAQKAWLEHNLEQQQLRHAQIVRDMEALTEQRDIWIDAFLQRIQERGFNYNCDALRQIPDAEIPQRPDRPFKVVY